LGYVLQKNEEVKIIESYTKILHVVNITQYHIARTMILKNIDQLNLSISDPLNTIIKNELKDLTHNINLLTHNPRNRQKRGLINIAGKIQKYIIGTMDSEDSEQIYKKLDELDKNSGTITNELNKQVIINNKLIRNLDTIEEHLNKQNAQITNYLYNIQNKTEELILTEHRLELLLYTSTLLQILNKQLEKFLDIILLSKLEILPHDILSDEEIQKYELTIDTIPFIKPNIIISNNLIAFCLKLPTLTKNKYHKTLIIPIPNNHSEELDYPITEVLTNENTIFQLPQQSLKESQLIKHKNSCIRNLLNNTQNCIFKINREQSVTQIEETLILKNIEETEILQNCNSFSPYNLKGNYIITFHLCKIKIKEIEYLNEENIKMQEIIMPKIYNNTPKILNNFTLEKVHLAEITNREIIELLTERQLKTDYTTYTGFIIIILISVIITLIYVKLKKNKSLEKKNEINIKFEKNIENPFENM